MHLEAGVATGTVFKFGQCLFMLAFDTGAVDFYGDDLVFAVSKFMVTTPDHHMDIQVV